MKIKTSITLSDDLLVEIDRREKEFASRSEFLEKAARGYLRELSQQEMDQKDLEIINSRADSLNEEAEDVLSYQLAL